MGTLCRGVRTTRSASWVVRPYAVLRSAPQRATAKKNSKRRTLAAHGTLNIPGGIVERLLGTLLLIDGIIDGVLHDGLIHLQRGWIGVYRSPVFLHDGDELLQLRIGHVPRGAQRLAWRNEVHRLVVLEQVLRRRDKRHEVPDRKS